MPPKSSAKKRREGKQAATAAEDRDNSVSSKESESAAESARALDESFKENEYAAESARVLDEALDLMTSDKQKQTLLKVVTKLTNHYFDLLTTYLFLIIVKEYGILQFR